MNYMDQLRTLTKETSEEKLRALATDPMVAQFPFHLVKPLDGVREVLEELRSEHKLALVTNANIGYVKKVLDMYDLTKYFDVIVTAEDTKAKKPDPEPLSIAAKKLGISPEEAISVGDYSTDVAAGKAAGMKVVLLSKEKDGREDARITSMRELPAAVRSLEPKRIKSA